MATVRLTDASIRKIISDAASGTRLELTDATTVGLKIRATADGRAVWSIKLRDMSGKQIRINLGEYPNLGISDARHEAAAARHKVRHEGKNPNAEKKAIREAANLPIDEGMTLKGLILAYGALNGERKSRLDADNRIKSVFAKFLDRPLQSIKRSELQIATDNWPSKSSAAAAVRYVRPILKWGFKRDYAPAELAMLDEPKWDRERDRYLTRDELLPVMRTLEESKDAHAAAMLFMLMTAARLNEVAKMRWSEITKIMITDKDEHKREIDVWKIPSIRLKNTRPDSKKKKMNRDNSHHIPLSRTAIKFIDSRRRPDTKPDDLVFPSSNNQILGNWDRFTKTIHKLSGVSNWHRHDLRRTVATHLGELSTPPYVIEAILGHSNIYTDLAGVYNLSRYLSDSDKALQDFADFMKRVLKDE